MEKVIGKIESVEFGHCGYQSCCLGISFTLKAGGWTVCTDTSAWDYEKIEHTKDSKWSQESRDKAMVNTLKYVSRLLKDAKVDSIDKLKSVPIEITFKGPCLESFRILTEAL